MLGWDTLKMLEHIHCSIQLKCDRPIVNLLDKVYTLLRVVWFYYLCFTPIKYCKMLDWT